MIQFNNQLSDILDNTPDILLDRRRLNSILNDIFPTQKDTVNILLLLYFDLKIHQEIFATNKTDIYFISRIARKLQRLYSINLEAGKKGVEIWVECLRNKSVPQPVLDVEFPIELEEPSEEKSGNYDVYFPCGVGIHDYGFTISGVKKSDRPCGHSLARIYAVIYGFLQRSLDVKEGDIYKQIADKYPQKMNYRRVYRLQILILYLLKNNYFSDNNLNVATSNWSKHEFFLAIASINRYTEIFCLLAKLHPQTLRISFDDESSIKIDISNKNGAISIVDSKKRISTFRHIWFEMNIKYAINKKNIKELKILLKDSFKYKEFLEGQFDALSAIINSDEDKLCIMPTGSGKSLIYYMAALFQPCPTMVISPTQILIQDQCDILKNKHEFDDIQQLDEYDNFVEFEPENKIIFLTPMTFLSCDLLNRVIRLNLNQHIANFVLDEVHCISNWSHDFRPEYLMLSFNLKYFVDKTRLLCFTATANYTVVKDLLIQLELNSDGDDIISPLDLKKPNQHFSFHGCQSDDECVDNITSKINDYLKRETIDKKRQLLVFTKQKDTSISIRDNLPKDIKPHVEVFSSDNTNSYADFASNLYKVLIGDSEVGVGINLPGVTDTYHYGVPISKSQYVQEIGRAGRELKNSNSEVIYKSRNSLSSEQSLILHRNTPISKIISVIKNSSKQDDLSQTFRKILGGVESQEEYIDGVLSLFNNILPITKSGEIKLIIDRNKTYSECLAQYMRYLYVLYRIGYIFNWYIANQNIEEGYVTFLIEISEHYDLESLKSTATRYLLKMGDYKEAVSKIKQSKKIEEVIENYISWHYNQFLYHHREQFLEMVDFLEFNNKAPDEQVSNALKEYFSLSLFEVKEDATRFNLLTIKDINLIINQNISSITIADIQKSIENEYSPKHDFLLFLHNIKTHNNLDVSRLERVVNQLSKNDFLELLGVIDQVYKICDNHNKVQIINAFCKRASLTQVLNSIYNKLDEDLVYFSIFSKCGNQNMLRSI